MSNPTKQSTYFQWTLPEATGIDSLRLETLNANNDETLGADEVVVDLYAASLNYRDLVVVKNSFPFPQSSSIRPNLVPGSDGSGIVRATGTNGRAFAPGDRVVTHMTPTLPDTQFPTLTDIRDGLGHTADGTLRQRGVFQQAALVHAPHSLSFDEAATLPCSGLTAFNALFGIRGREVRAGDWVLVQGTGGVSVAALQFAVAAGANVVATTSSEAKAERLKGLGAREVVNYRSTPDWGQAARKFTRGGVGFDMVVDIAGDATLGQSVQAVRTDGIVVAAGVIGGVTENSVPMMAALMNVCIVRGIVLGTREQFREMVKFIDEHGVRPVVDDKVFDIQSAKEAFGMLERQEHFSKIVIKLR